MRAVDERVFCARRTHGVVDGGGFGEIGVYAREIALGFGGGGEGRDGFGRVAHGEDDVGAEVVGGEGCGRADGAGGAEDYDFAGWHGEGVRVDAGVGMGLGNGDAGDVGRVE